MNWNPINWFENNLNEEIKAFKNKDNKLTPKQLKAQSGEGYYDVSGYGAYSAGSFNSFYNRYINDQHNTKLSRVKFYREMSNNPEIADVLEDAVNESTQEDDEGKVISLKITDEELSKKESTIKNLNHEFHELFFDKINITDQICKWYYRYLVDSEIFTENIINVNKTKEGIIKVKMLPIETMDILFNEHDQIDAYIQYNKKGTKKPKDLQEAKVDKDITVFEPAQINHLKYGHGNERNAYLEKAKVPYNQLKLLETSLIIFRIVRAPERFVFKIDTGNMPREKAMKYVEKIKKKMNRKESFDSETGTLTKSKDVLCIRQNTEIKLLDGRHLPLNEIINEFNEGNENWVYTVNQDTHEIEPGKIINAKINRLNEKLIRVHLDDGSYVDTTYDHKFIMRDGSEKRADELKEDDSLMPLYTKKDKINNNYKQDYEYVYDLKTNKWVTTHKMVSNNVQKKRESNECIHHKDFNPFNNNPDNLFLMNFKDHISYHGKLTKQRWENDYKQMYANVLKGRETFKNNPVAVKKMKQKLRDFWKDNYEEMCGVRNEQWKKLKNDPEFMKEVSERTIYWNKKLNKVEKLLESLNEPENREKQKKGASKSKTEYFQNPENRKKQGENMKRNQANNPEAFLNNSKKPKTDSHKSKIGITLKNKWNNDLEYREKHIQINRERYDNDPTLKERISKAQTLKTNDHLNGIIVKECKEDSNITLKKLAIKLTNNENFISTWKDLNKDIKAVKKDKITVASLYKIINRMGYDGFNDFKENAKYNHKVTRIEYLDERDDTGCITVEGNHNFAISMHGKPSIFVSNSIMDNFFIPQGENRGSDISTIGGQSGGFGELDDVFYFQKKLYRALKYPLSRIENKFENRSSDNLFQGQSFDEVTRDEIKWSKFLEKQQRKFSEYLMRIFLIHLDFKQMKSRFNLTSKQMNISFIPPSEYKEQMKQRMLETQFNNYTALSNEPEFSKYYLMKKFLGWTDEEIKENADMKKKDKELGFAEEEGGFGF